MENNVAKWAEMDNGFIQRGMDFGCAIVEEFHKAFGAHIADKPAVPPVEDEAHNDISDYAVAARRLSVQLKHDALTANQREDKAGGLLLIRLQLIQEELAELAEAFAETDTVGAFDALTDITYVVDGTYLAVGLHGYKVAGQLEVHRTNMNKLGPDGKPIVSAAGRVVKPEGWVGPKLRRILGL